MRRGWVLAVVGVAVLALAGCGKPGGVDGNLTNAWPALPAAKTPVPKVGVCYPNENQTTWYGDFTKAVDCAPGQLQTETGSFGSLSGVNAARQPPQMAD